MHMIFPFVNDGADATNQTKTHTFLRIKLVLMKGVAIKMTNN